MKNKTLTFLKLVILNKKRMNKKQKIPIVDISNITSANVIITYLIDLVSQNNGIGCIPDIGDIYPRNLIWECDNDQRQLLANEDLYEEIEKCRDEAHSRFIVLLLVLTHQYNCDITALLHENETYEEMKERINPLNGHLNVLLYDKKYKTLERYDPSGGESYNSEWYQQNILDDILPDFFRMFVPVRYYFKPLSYCPKSIQR
jgi:hypothetical protein